MRLFILGLLLLMASPGLVTGQEITAPADAATLAGTLRFETSTQGKFITDFDTTGGTATWAVTFPSAGDYDVWVNYAYREGEGGGTGEIAVGNAKILFSTRATASWAEYKEANIGPVKISNAGANVVTFRCRAKPGTGFMNLRGLRFVPANNALPPPVATTPPPKPAPVAPPAHITILKIGADGTLTLPLTNAYVLGSAVRYNSEPNRPAIHFGHWVSLEDKVCWTVETTNARSFTLHVAGVSDPPKMGGQLEVAVNNKPAFVCNTPASSHHNEFAWFTAGNLSLPAGRSVISLRAAKINDTWLMDLSSARLTAPGGKPDPVPPFIPTPPPALKRLIGPEIDGSVTLPINDALLTGGSIRLLPSQDGKPAKVSEWANTNQTATWQVNIPSARTCDLRLQMACAGPDAGGELDILLNGKSVAKWNATPGSDPNAFAWITAAQVALPAGKSILAIRPSRVTGKNLFDLAAARLTTVSAPLSKVENGQLVTTRNINEPLRDGTIRLDASDAEFDGGALRLDFFDALQHIGNWNDPTASVQWPVRLRKTGTYIVEARLACDPAWSGSRIRVSLGGVSVETTITATGGANVFSQATLTRLANVPAGDAVFRISVVNKPGPLVMNLRSVKLIPPP